MSVIEVSQRVLIYNPDTQTLSEISLGGFMLDQVL